MRVCVRACVCVSECYSLYFFCLLSSLFFCLFLVFFFGGGGGRLFFLSFFALPCHFEDSGFLTAS